MSTPLGRAADALWCVLGAGILWVVACVPVVTIGPATVALFTVMSAWDEGPPPVWATFVEGFRRRWRESLVVGVLALVAAAVLVVDVSYGLRADGAPFRALVLGVAVAAALILTAMLVQVFALLARDGSSRRTLLRDSAALAVRHPVTTVLGMAVIAMAAMATAVAPPLLPLSVSLTAYALVRLSRRCEAH
ncbi:MAG: DUF624 domain-containing protein [Streptosporangiales bacterium]|nr:DUF624 domain-containing protein [Streptosporangiales bacterium]